MTRSSGPAARALAWLMLLFPRAFRAHFGEDVEQLFLDQLQAAHRRFGWRGAARYWVRCAPRLVGSALLEHAESMRAARAGVAERVAVAAAFQSMRHGASGAGTPLRSDGMMEALRHDLQYAVRVLRKSPVFTVVAVLCISIGSGAVTTIFSAMNALVLRPLAGAGNHEGLVLLERKRAGSDDGISASYPYLQWLRERTRTLSGIAAWGKVSLTLAEGGKEGTAAWGSMVTSNFFQVFGVRPALGHLFTADDDREGAASPSLVVSHAFWRSRLHGDSSVIGKVIGVNGHSFVLVGVVADGFTGADNIVRTDAWVPVSTVRLLTPRRPSLQDPGGSWLKLAGLLKPGVTVIAAQRELSALTATLAQEKTEPAAYSTYNELRLSPLRGLPPDASGPLTGFLALLLGASTLVLLIASVNVASMLSARAIQRQREFAIRAALGAARARIVRQLLTEILVLFLLGAAGGVTIAIVATRLLEQLTIPGAGAVAVMLELSPDLRVLAFALALSLVTGLLFGLSHALGASRTDLSSRLRSDATAGTARRTFLGNALVVGQLALSLTLLVAAGLFLRALDRGRSIDSGMDLKNVAVSLFDTEAWGYDEGRARAFTGALRERLAAVPGVVAVSYSHKTPLTMNGSIDNMLIEGAGTSDAERVSGVPTGYFAVDADYFQVVGIPIVRGASFGVHDGAGAARVAVVNESLARRYWPDGSAVGRTFRYRGERITIVGVARDAKYQSLSDVPAPFVFFPVAQQWESTQTLLVRGTVPPLALATAIQSAVHSIDPALPRARVTTLEQEAAISLLPQRVAAMVTGALGAVGLLLATVGLYGIMAYSTNRRTREIGLRMALGARQGDVVRMVLRDGLRLTVVGVVIGCVLAASITRLLSGFLFNVSPLDAMTFVGMSALFSTVALVACYLPARKAALADPMAVIRVE